MCIGGNYLDAASRKLCLPPVAVPFPQEKLSNWEKMYQEIKPGKGMGGKETNVDETAQ